MQHPVHDLVWDLTADNIYEICYTDIKYVIFDLKERAKLSVILIILLNIL